MNSTIHLPRYIRLAAAARRLNLRVRDAYEILVEAGADFRIDHEGNTLVAESDVDALVSIHVG